MTLDEIESLAKFAAPVLSAHDAFYISACSPPRILAMIECIKAADAMRGWINDPIDQPDGIARDVAAFDSARAKLDEAMK